MNLKPNGYAIVCSCRTNVPGVIPIVKELFKGHNNLISGINIFLPKGSVTALDNDGAHPQELFNEAWSFVTKIKVKLLFCSVEFQLQMLVPSILMMTFVPTETLSKWYKCLSSILRHFKWVPEGAQHKYSPQSGKYMLWFCLFHCSCFGRFSCECKFQYS